LRLRNVALVNLHNIVHTIESIQMKFLPDLTKPQTIILKSWPF
jgi:hypothetical protein